MKKKADRKFSSLNRTLQKAYWKISIYNPSHTLFALISAGIAIFLLGGGIYDILTIKNPPYSYPYYIYWITRQGRIIFFHPGAYGGYDSLQYQLVGGSIIVMTIYALGTLGFLMVYQSMKYAHKPRQTTILLMIGLTFISIAFILTEYILYNEKIYFSMG